MSSAALARLLGSLYITQYLGVGFLFIGLGGILRQQGVDLEKLAIVQIIGLAWAVKFLWAPLIDRFGSSRFGHYRSWLLVLQPLMVVSLLALLVLRPTEEQLPTLAIVISVFVLASATQDVAADALAVRLTEHGQRGLANGFQVAGGYIGNLIGGGAIVALFDAAGWIPAVLVLAACTAVAMIAIIALREQVHLVRSDRPSLAEAYRSMWTVFRQPGAAWWAFATVPLLYVGVSIGYALLTPALVDLGWSLTQIGLTVTMLGSVPAILGALAGGWAIRRFGRRPTLLVGGVGAVVGTILLLPMFGGYRDDLTTTLAVCLYLGLYAVTSAVIFTVNMDFARPATAGSDYTVFSSLAMFAAFIAGGISLAVAGAVGYVPVVLVSVVMVVLGVIVGWWRLGIPATTQPEVPTTSLEVTHA